MTTTTATGRTVATSSAIPNGATLMAVAAAGFIGYAVLFLVRNFTDSFLELGEDAAAVRPVLPRGAGGGVVITSRNPAWRRDATMLSVEVLERDEAVAFLLERTGQQDIQAAEQLPDALGELPLAREQAGAYIDEQGGTLSGYVRRLHTRAPELFVTGQPPDYMHTVATTWAASFQAVELAAPVAADLLRLCAFLGPTPSQPTYSSRARRCYPSRWPARPPTPMSSPRPSGRVAVMPC
jgi:hypothetical protein